MSKRHLAFAAVPVAFALAALPGGSGLLAAQVDAPVAAPAPALNDPTIVAIFDNANSFDIETGKLAAKRGHPNEVRQFGAMLARDHDMVRQQGRDLAKKLGVTPTPPAGDQSARDQGATLHRLSGLRGAAFDRAFLQHEAAFHTEVIAAIQSTLLPAIKNEELRSLVVKVAPAFQAHLAMAQNLGKRLATR
jgi:putative membrane protein